LALACLAISASNAASAARAGAASVIAANKQQAIARRIDPGPRDAAAGMERPPLFFNLAGGGNAVFRIPIPARHISAIRGVNLRARGGRRHIAKPDKPHYIVGLFAIELNLPSRPKGPFPRITQNPDLDRANGSHGHKNA
jgi:hypothetical protein